MRVAGFILPQSQRAYSPSLGQILSDWISYFLSQYIAEKILNINEGGTFSPHEHLMNETARITQDNELFERARLVNCGFFMQVILRDYVGVILALTQEGLHWRLNPLEVAYHRS